MKSAISKRLRPNSIQFIIYATLAAFFTYTSMYAVRKAFAAGTYAGTSFFGIEYKIWLIIAQVIGYTISKFVGIKIVAEATHRSRPKIIVGLIAFSILSLFFFAIIPEPYGIICLLLNGLPIGMVFGLVFNYLEGRRSTEILVIGLTITQIFSSAFVKTIGRLMINNWHIPDAWMPFLVGIAFFPILLIAVWMLEQLPDQSTEDISLKSERTTMNKEQRKQFVATFFWGLFVFMLSYVLLTAYRDYRDNFAVEIWNGMGIKENAILLSLTEIPTSVIILFMMIFLQSIKNNMKAFVGIHLLAITGGVIALCVTLMYGKGMIDPIVWISCTSIGLYLAYVPANTIFFERLFAVFRYPGNASFVVIMADFFGYCGSIGVLLYKNFSTKSISYADFFYDISIVVPIILILTQIFSIGYYIALKKKDNVSIANV